MRETLKKLKLIDEFTITIKIDKEKFMKRFSAKVDKGGTGTFSGMFDPFSSSKNEYRGSVGLDRFEIKRKRKFFDRNKMMAVAKGHFYQRLEGTEIQVEVNSFNKAMIPIFIFIIIFYLVFIIGFTASGNNEMGFIGIPFILLHASFMIGIPYFMMRKSVKNMMVDLEKEFKLLTIE